MAKLEPTSGDEAPAHSLTDGAQPAGPRRWLRRAVVAFVVCAVFVSACFFVFGVPLTASLVAGAGFAAFRGRGAITMVVLFAAALSAPLEYAGRVHALRADLDAGRFGVRDAAGVWVLNLGMAGAGLIAGFPEAALETTLLVFPDDDGVRTFSSSFAMGTPRVAAVVDDWRRRCSTARRFGPTTITLPNEGGHAELRRALALTPVTLAAVRADDGALDVSAEVNIDYPDARLQLGGPVVVDEGLFDALERRGWLFPYTARWTWRVPCSREGDRASVAF